MQRDNRFFIDPSDIRSDLTWKWQDDENKKNEKYYEINGDEITFRHDLTVNKIKTNKIQPLNGIIEINGILKVDKIETKTFENINFSKLIEKQVYRGDLEVIGDFNITGNVNWSGKTNFIDTQIIRAEDNVINLNYNGNHKTSKNGGIILKHGCGENEDCNITIDESGYWNINPGVNLIAANIQNLNIERDDDLIIFFNGRKIKLLYEEIE